RDHRERLRLHAARTRKDGVGNAGASRDRSVRQSPPLLRDDRIAPRRPHPCANIRASCSSTGVTALKRRAAAASTESPAVSTTADARAYSGSRLSKMLRNSAIAERSSAIG